MATWGFYGRVAESAKLRKDLHIDMDWERRALIAYMIPGRRGVGKSELVKHVGAAAGTTPFLYMEVGRGVTIERCLSELEDNITAYGLDHMAENVVHGPKHGAWKKFTNIVAHLLSKGVIVAIDEIHRGLGNGLVGQITIMLNEIIPKCEDYPGKLLVMTSHQQQGMELVGPKGPFHQRVVPTVKVRPWKVATVLEMADEHGLLAWPDRLLALWAAYGGVPRYWSRFVRNPGRLDGYMSIRDGNEWRKTFIADEMTLLDGYGERYDSGVYMEFEGLTRAVMLAIADSPSKVMSYGELRRLTAETLDMEKERHWKKLVSGGFGPEDDTDPPGLKRTLNELRADIGVIDRVFEFLMESDTGYVRYRLADANGEFQMRVFRDTFSRNVEPEDKDVEPVDEDVEGSPDIEEWSMDRRLAALQELEGRAFENFCAGWMQAFPDTVWTEYGSWRRRRETLQGDVDVTAMVGTGGNARLWLGSCKRDPAQHDPEKTHRRFDEVLKVASESSGKARHRKGWPIPAPPETGTLSDAEREEAIARHTEIADEWQETPGKTVRAAFSPVIDDGHRRTLEDAGLATFDILDMAGKLGFGPKAPERHDVRLERYNRDMATFLEESRRRLVRAGVDISGVREHGKPDPERLSAPEFLRREREYLERRATQAEKLLDGWYGFMNVRREKGEPMPVFGFAADRPDTDLSSGDIPEPDTDGQAENDDTGVLEP